ncbi:LOW QUALITY PROTEIN: TATA element modulatory factor-like [Haliotis rubra]|uniref:LOW QUALITY PROTEIN: TATA element modulatory factor-like n=1 Tax=Haliotis rubra TaxID=36100 RepID=UPI001EE630EC|nr:LOW QUALITY PROTEIN: TATA element modulatory factor-like [Haliotis rubra]
MSWWDTSNITNLASQALKNAQKSIDKALDISEEDGKTQAAIKAASASKQKTTEKPSGSGGGDFWNSWLGAGQKAEGAQSAPAKKPETEKEGTQAIEPSSWNFGWSGQSESEKGSESETSSSWSSFDLGGLTSKGSKTKEGRKAKIDEKSGGPDRQQARGPLHLGQKKSLKSPRSSTSGAVGQASGTSSVTESVTSDEDEGKRKEEGGQLQQAHATTLVSADSSEDMEACGFKASDPEPERESDVSPEKGCGTSEKHGDDSEHPTNSEYQIRRDESVSEEGLFIATDFPPFDTSNPDVQDVKMFEKVPATDFMVTSSTDQSQTDTTQPTSCVYQPDHSIVPDDNMDAARSESIISVGENETIVSSTEGSLDTSQRVVLEIPSGYAEQIGPSTPLSSEASIITLSSPGQDDLDYQCSPPQSISSQQITSEYINISTTQIQAPMDNMDTLCSVDTPSVESISSEVDPADASALEREFLEKDQIDLGQSSGNDSSDASKLDSSMDTCTSGETVVGPSVVVERESDSDHEHDIEKSDESFPTTSPNSSFVKNMLEEAMEDVSKPEDSGSDNHSCGEKSESSKVESEIDKSISGQESSDDIETTTSSDIEIISTPTPNGDKNERPFDLSPLRIALQKTVDRRRDRETHSHRRTDSQSSSSTYSKAGESDQMSPGRDSLERQDLESGDEDLRAPDLSAVTEEDIDNPYHPQKLLQGVPTQQQHEIIKKLAEQAEVLQHRENKLVQLSKENNDLLETNSILRNQLQQVEELRETEMTDLNILTEEFTKRLSEAEKKLQSSIKEKEALKRQLQTAQDELKKSASDVSQQCLLEEKDEQIAELLQEGEKLSKQQLQSNNIIKKLRSKEKENESVLSSQKKNLEEQKTELEHLRKVCDAKDDLEKKQIEAISQLNNAVQKQEKELLKFRSEQEDVQEKERSLQTALENAYKEIADLHKMNAAQDSKAQEAALSAERCLREALKMDMEHEKMKHKQEREALIMQIEDLRLTMARMDKDHNRREDMLRQEISDLQMQLQEDEARTQELSHSVSSATRPLLRQIENLQANYTAQSTSWEKVERNITERLADAQSQLALAVEKERTVSEKLMEQNIRLSTLESQTARLRQEKSQLLAQAEMDKAKIELLEESKLNEMAQVDAVKNKLSKEITELKKDKVFLETQVEMEKTKVETEKKRVAMMDDQIRLMERERPKSRGTPSPVSVSRQESVSSFQEDLLERTLMLSSPNGSKMNLYESLRQSGAATLLENLQSQLKQREGEIIQLQSEIASLERTRESMAKELVNLTNQNEELEEQVHELPQLQEKYRDLDQRYNALLQMYGEKVEQTEELKLDLEDVKDMYKAQIDHLLAK